MAFDTESFLEMLSARNPLVIVSSDGAISEVYYPGVKVEQNSDPAFVLLDLDDPDSEASLYYNEIVAVLTDDAGYTTSEEMTLDDFLIFDDNEEESEDE
jgi:hypothetical protein